MRKLKTELWPHVITVKRWPMGNEGDQWCKQELGRRFRDWYSYSMDDQERTRTFAFKDTETLLVFKLKWGHLQ